MQQTIRGVKLPFLAHQVFQFSTRPLALLILLPVVSFFSLVVVAIMPGRDVADTHPLDRFAGFSDLFPGQQVDARQIEVAGFSCLLETAPVPADTSLRCSRDLGTGPFSHVSVVLWDGVVNQFEVTVREQSLRLGDLVLLWGDPEISVTNSLVMMRWPAAGIIAVGRSFDAPVTYLQTISNISFG